MSGVVCSLTHGLFDSLSFLLEMSMSGVVCSLTHGLFDSLSFLLEKSMSGVVCSLTHGLFEDSLSFLLEIHVWCCLLTNTWSV